MPNHFVMLGPLFARHTLLSIAILAASLLVTFTQPRSLHAQAPSAQGVVEQAMVRMPDGVALAARIVRPGGQSSRAPTILLRTPYGQSAFSALVHALVDAGYAVVVQDVRGQGRSEGVFVPFIHERADGLATLNWIVQQEWSDGRVGLWGASYLGYAALILTAADHPALRAVVNISGWSEVTPLTHPGGALHLMLTLPWMLTAQGDRRLSFDRLDWPDVFRRAPILDIPTTLDAPNAADAWQRAARVSFDSSLERTRSLAGQYEKVGVPILHVTGWNDFAGRQTLMAYERIAAHKRVVQRLLVGPWRHDQVFTSATTVGDADFGAASIFGWPEVIRHTVAWFDEHILERAALPASPVRVFVMDRNEWLDADQWPPRDVQVQTWYLTATNGSGGNGRLTRALPTRRRSEDTFRYDPLNPVPTVGGANFHFFTKNLGVRDQREMLTRDDVLVYVTDAAKTPMDIVGPLRVVLHASSTAPFTDFTAKLSIVRPDGYVRIVEDGIRRGPDSGRPRAGHVQRYTIDLGYTAVHVPAGHQLRIEISSSNFPKYSRNPNTGELPEAAERFETAEQRIFLSRRRPSYLVVPVRPLSDGRP